MNNNNTTGDYSDTLIPESSKTNMPINLRVFVAVASGLVSFPGLPGNTLVMFLTLKHKEIRSEIYTWLLFNLALVDFSFCFQRCFLQTVFILKPESIGCKIAAFLEFFTGITSFFVPALVALNRYTKVIHGEAIYQKWFFKRNMILMNLFPWLWNGVFLLPYIISGRLGPEPMGICGLQISTIPLNIYFMVTSATPIGITYCLVVFCYLKFRQHLASHAQDAGYLQSPVIKESSSIMWATKLICFIPLAAQLPSVLNKMLVPFGVFRVNPWLPWVFAAFFPLTSTCNPYITLFVVKPYKKGLKEIWCHVGNSVVHPETAGQAISKNNKHTPTDTNIRGSKLNLVSQGRPFNNVPRATAMNSNTLFIEETLACVGSKIRKQHIFAHNVGDSEQGTV